MSEKRSSAAAAAASAAEVRARLARYRDAKAGADGRCGTCQEGLVVEGRCAVCISRQQAEPAVPDTPPPPPPLTAVQRARLRVHEMLEAPGPLKWRWSSWLKLIVCLLLAVVSWELAVMPIYICLVTLFGIVQMTRDSPPKPGELSAYSVFNKNFEKLPGTFDADQIDRQFRSGRMF